ncbi:hypothetical protein A6A27_10805 [Micromonospora sp. CB01531]|nr:hypothetical protein A6A27_10805 [Micromonospora sp. CB01531]
MSVIQTVGLVFFVAVLLTVLVLMVITLLKPRASRSDDGSGIHPLHPPADGGAGGDAGGGADSF